MGGRRGSLDNDRTARSTSRSRPTGSLTVASWLGRRSYSPARGLACCKTVPMRGTQQFCAGGQSLFRRQDTLVEVPVDQTSSNLTRSRPERLEQGWQRCYFSARRRTGWPRLACSAVISPGEPRTRRPWSRATFGRIAARSAGHHGGLCPHQMSCPVSWHANPGQRIATTQLPDKEAILCLARLLLKTPGGGPLRIGIQRTRRGCHTPWKESARCVYRRVQCYWVLV